MFTEAENTRAFLENYIWRIAERAEKQIRGGFWNIHYELMQSKDQSQLASFSIYDELFYMENRYGSIISARVVLGKILNYISSQSIIDFGCGTGTWLWVAKSLGVSEVLGIDGDYVPENMLMIPKSCFQAADLSKPFSAPKKYDMAMSLEVAEHLPENSADDFISGICGSSDIVLFSAAHPGQGGDGHINEQPKNYWINKFAVHNYKPIEIAKHFSDNDKIEWWYKENLVLFVSLDKYEEVRSKMKQG